MPNKTSLINNLRKYHNWIKSTMLKEVSNELRSDNVNYIRLLDVSTGKGGDLYKWKIARINYVLGFDVDKESIYGSNGANDRYKEMKPPKPRVSFFQYNNISRGGKYPYQGIKKVIDMKSKNHQFNVVTCMFALHYMFEDEVILRHIISMVSKLLVKGGFFMGTTLDGNIIDDKLKVKGELSNDVYSMRRLYDKKTMFGSKYAFNMNETEKDTNYFKQKGESEEYLVDFNILEKVCSDYNLKPYKLNGRKSVHNFSEWYKEYDKKNLTNSEKEPSFLNSSFIFVKV